VLKRIIALPTIPHDETYDIKSRAQEILKGWTEHLDEIAKTEKKDVPATEEKKVASGSDAEKDKSPVVAPEPMDVDKNGPEPPKEAAKQEPPKDEENETVGELMAVDEPSKKEDAPEEDFVMVDGGGEGDELAQEKAVAQKPVAEEPKTQEPAPLGAEKEEEGGTAEPAASSIVPAN
jgi:hypothetical protein